MAVHRYFSSYIEAASPCIVVPPVTLLAYSENGDNQHVSVPGQNERSWSPTNVLKLALAVHLTVITCYNISWLSDVKLIFQICVAIVSTGKALTYGHHLLTIVTVKMLLT